MTAPLQHPDHEHPAWWHVSAQARVSMLPAARGGKSGPIWERYSPSHKLQEGLYCMGAFTSIEGGHISPGETGLAEITFLVVEELTTWFKPGLQWKLNEAGRTVGEGEIMALLALEPVAPTAPPRRLEPDAGDAHWHRLQVEADVSLLAAAEGGRSHPVWEHWSPEHVFAGGVSCAGRITHITGEKIMPGAEGVARIEFTVSAPHRALFKPGATWAIYDRGHRVGTGMVRSAREKISAACHWRSRE